MTVSVVSGAMTQKMSSRPFSKVYGFFYNMPPKSNHVLLSQIVSQKTETNHENFITVLEYTVNISFDLYRYNIFIDVTHDSSALPLSIIELLFLSFLCKITLFAVKASLYLVVNRMKLKNIWF